MIFDSEFSFFLVAVNLICYNKCFLRANLIIDSVLQWNKIGIRNTLQYKQVQNKISNYRIKRSESMQPFLSLSVQGVDIYFDILYFVEV